MLFRLAQQASDHGGLTNRGQSPGHRVARSRDSPARPSRRTVVIGPLSVVGSRAESTARPDLTLGRIAPVSLIDATRVHPAMVTSSRVIRSNERVGALRRFESGASGLVAAGAALAASVGRKRRPPADSARHDGDRRVSRTRARDRRTAHRNVIMSSVTAWATKRSPAPATTSRRAPEASHGTDCRHGRVHDVRGEGGDEPTCPLSHRLRRQGTGWSTA